MERWQVRKVGRSRTHANAARPHTHTTLPLVLCSRLSNDCFFMCVGKKRTHHAAAAATAAAATATV
jgi:hypothetical protein